MGIQTTYPFDDDSGIALGAPGIWFPLTTAPGFVGLAESEYPPVPTTGNRESRRAGFEVALNEALQALCEIRSPSADIPADDPRRTTAEPFTRYETSDREETDWASSDELVVRVVQIEVEVRSINPVVLGAARVSNGASRVVRV